MKTLTEIKALLAVFVLFSLSSKAKENVGQYPKKQAETNFKLSAACSQSGSRIDLDLNNVRTKILGGGDMWWDLTDAKYEIPKDSKKNSLFAGSIWIGGLSQGTNLKVAAMTYRQNGNDFWPGPLDKSNASIIAQVCSQYDRHYVITRKEVEEFYAAYLEMGASAPVPASIENWPAFDPYGNTNITQALAPFFDADQDGEYNPRKGDYPGYSLHGEMGDCKSESQLFGDRTLWWVFNDKGNIHSESEGAQVGLEIHAQAFAFATNDEINNMTFYQYQIFNRSSDKLDECYMSVWVDPDLGNPNDDFIGCDVGRGLGFCYNGDADDDGNGENHYGLNPPAVGVDYFEGPLADPDSIDNPASATFNGTGYGDNIVDNERLGMEKFTFYANDFSLTGNPQNTQDYFNYMRGIWRDNTPMTYGGNGHLSSSINCNFMFPWDTDPSHPGNPWYQNSVADGRFLHCSGPFTLKPGAVNFVTTGVVWAQASSGGPLASVNLMKAADDKAQRLFDNCFQVLNGPDAPDLTIRELDRELILYLSNKPNSNNYQDKYKEFDPGIASPPGQNPPYDPYYRFQGYQIFQMKTADASVNDVHNPDLARLVAQCDLKDGVIQLVNFKYDQSLNANVPELEVVGNNSGIEKSFRILEDAFATGDKRLINHKSYYFLAIAYGYNNYKTYDQGDPLTFDGQKQPYKVGRNNIGKGGKPYTGIPHIPAPENNGTVVNSTYGQEPEITRIEGQGNGGNYLDLIDESVNSLLSNPNFKQITYKAGLGPIKIKVIDPLAVKAGSYTFKLVPPGYTPTAINTAKWVVTNTSTNEQLSSDNSINIGAEQLTNWGFSVKVEQSSDPGTIESINNGLISASIEFADPSKKWLSGVPDADFPFPVNWIRAGTTHNNPADPLSDDYKDIDNTAVYEGLLPVNIGYGSGGTWAPYRLCAQTTVGTVPGGSAPGLFCGPAWADATIMNSVSNFGNLASVDIVITSDKSKWTRCVVFETNDDTTKSSTLYATRKLDLRKSPSVDKDGQADNSGTMGMSWFPGYAINVETGERLNMAFGEDSHFDGVSSPSNEHGADMIWNPTSNVDFNNVFSTTPNPAFGGKHYVYVFNHNTTDIDTALQADNSNVPAYDSCRYVYSKMKNNNFHPNNLDKRNVFKDIIWTGIPLLAVNQELFACDVKIKLRVSKPYENNFAASGFKPNKSINMDGPRAIPAQNNNYPLYAFDMSNFATVTYDKETAQNALSLINAVPNPYYAFSSYEKNQVDNEIKITNLPQKCTIKIYTMSGILVREINKDEAKTSLNWDLKNQVGIPISSGAYLIHVDAPQIGEKVVKWFGALRPLDLDTY